MSWQIKVVKNVLFSHWCKNELQIGGGGGGGGGGRGGGGGGGAQTSAQLKCVWEANLQFTMC